MSTALTAERLRELLYYNPATGRFTWTLARRNVRVGNEAGHADPRGYRYISIDNRQYCGHRLAWLYMTGEWPKSIVDHRNGKKGDNRWRNLRDTSAHGNAQNLRAPTTRNQLGFLGVIPPQGKRTQFKASIQVHGKSMHLGYHATPELAHAAYIAAKRQLHEGNTL